MSFAQAQSGRWEEAVAAAELQLGEGEGARGTFLSSLPEIHAARGEPERIETVVRTLRDLGGGDDLQTRSMYVWASGLLAQLRGDHRVALEAGLAAMQPRTTLGMGFVSVKQGFVLAVEAALALGDDARAAEILAILDTLPPAQVFLYYQAHRDRFLARLAARRGDATEPEARFKGSAGLFRELGMPFWLAVTLLEHAEWLYSDGRRPEAEPLLAEARAIFERLDARPWLERMERVPAARTAAEAIGTTAIDVDRVIEERVGKPIARVFDEDGERRPTEELAAA
jgi:hypothetical protein